MDSRDTRRAGQIEVARAGILAAAAKVFLKDGYQRATMRGIAKEAGYTASSLYTYFPSKEAMFRSLRDSLKTRGFEMLETKLPASLAFPQRLEMLSLRILELSQDMREALMLYVVADAQLPDDTLEDRLGHSREFYQRLEQWIVENATAEELNGHEPIDIAYTFFGLIEAQLRRVMGTGEFREERFAAGLELARDYTLRILATPA